MKMQKKNLKIFVKSNNHGMLIPNVVPQVVPAVPFFTVIMATQAAQDKLVQSQRCLQMWEQGLSDLIQPPILALQVGKKSIAAAYNEAISNAATPYVILAHNDAFPLATLGERVGQRLKDHCELHGLDLAGFCGASRLTGPRWQDATPFLYGGVLNLPPQPQPGQPLSMICWRRPARVVTNIRTLDGYCLVGRTAALKELALDESFEGFHYYDVDLALRAHAAGKKTAVICDTVIAHQSTVGYADPEWRMELNKFVAKWAGRADLTIPGVQVTPSQIVSADIATLLAQNEAEIKCMAPIVEGM